MRTLKEEIQDIIDSIDKMHKKDPEFNTSTSRTLRKRALRALFLIDKGVDKRIIDGLLRSLEKLR